MENVKKVTKKEMFGRLIGIVENAAMAENEMNEMVEFLNHEIELVSKKRTGLTKAQKANEGLVEIIYEAIAKFERPVSIAEIYEAVKDVEGITSTNKVLALVKKLKDAERVVRTEEKRKAYFAIAG